jgi:hypothetical protein
MSSQFDVLTELPLAFVPLATIFYALLVDGRTDLKRNSKLMGVPAVTRQLSHL